MHKTRSFERHSRGARAPTCLDDPQVIRVPSRSANLHGPGRSCVHRCALLRHLDGSGLSVGGDATAPSSPPRPVPFDGSSAGPYRQGPESADVVISACARDHWSWRWAARLTGCYDKVRTPPDVRAKTTPNDAAARSIDRSHGRSPRGLAMGSSLASRFTSESKRRNSRRRGCFEGWSNCSRASGRRRARSPNPGARLIRSSCGGRFHERCISASTRVSRLISPKAERSDGTRN
jgi:hypothetical protein